MLLESTEIVKTSSDHRTRSTLSRCLFFTIYLKAVHCPRKRTHQLYQNFQHGPKSWAHRQTWIFQEQFLLCCQHRCKYKAIFFLRPIVLKFDWILISTRPFLKIFLILLCMVLRGMPNSFEISLFSKPGINREIIL